jgi:hypothetical protein
VVPRGRVVPLLERVPLVDLCQWAHVEGEGVVQALAFPVNPQEGN